MKKALILLVISILGLSLTGASTPVPKQIIRVGVYENSPKIFTNEQGDITGFWPALIEVIAEKENWQIEWVPGTWEEGLTRLQNHEIDLMPDVAWTEERAGIFNFSTETVLVSWSRVYVSEGSSIQTILDLDGRRVAGLEGSANFDGPEGIKDLAEKFNVNCTFIGLQSYEEVFKALENKEVDAGVTNRSFGDTYEQKYDISRTPIILQPVSLFFAYPKDSPIVADLIDTIDADLKDLKSDSQSQYYQILDQFMGGETQKTIIEIIPTWVYLVLGNLAIAILLLVVMSLASRRQIKLRTAELSASEARYRALLETNPDLIFRISKEGVFLDYHPSKEDKLFIPPETFLDKKAEEVLPPKLAKATMEKSKKALDTGEIQFYEYQLDIDGEKRDFEARYASHGNNEVIAFVRDITQRKQAERELIASEKRYQTLTDIVPVGIFHTDKSGMTIYVNPTWCQLAGLPEQEALGSGWLKAVHPDDRETITTSWQQAADREAISVRDYRFLHKDGSEVWVMGKAVPELDSDNQLVGFVGTITDITERKKVEDLQAAVIRAESADRLKSAFLATMSHELRTPLNSIIGFTGILLQNLVGPLNEEQTKQLRMVQGSANHLLELINDVLDISKIEAGQVQLFCSDFDIAATIQKCVEKLLPLAEKKGLSIFTQTTPASITLHSDQRRVEQILINLINNSIKFTEHGEIKVLSTLIDGQVITSVHDTGIGVKPEDVKTLFKPFQQIDSGISRQYEGTGLGLSICKRLVDLLGGTISMESEWGKGSVFTFSIPIRTDKS